MICKNKQGHHAIVPHVLHYLKLQVIDTVWPLNTGQDNEKSPGGTSQMVNMTA